MLCLHSKYKSGCNVSGNPLASLQCDTQLSGDVACTLAKSAYAQMHMKVKPACAHAHGIFERSGMIKPQLQQPSLCCGSCCANACLMQMLLKCADIGHLAADRETHKKWAYMLEEEFFQQV